MEGNKSSFVDTFIHTDPDLLRLYEKFKNQVEDSKVVDKGWKMFEILLDGDVPFYKKMVPLGLGVLGAVWMSKMEGPIPNDIKTYGELDNVALGMLSIAAGFAVMEKWAGDEAGTRADAKISAHKESRAS